MQEDPGRSVALRAEWETQDGPAEVAVCSGCGFMDLAPAGLLPAIHHEDPFCPNCGLAWPPLTLEPPERPYSDS